MEQNVLYMTYIYRLSHWRLCIKLQENRDEVYDIRNFLHELYCGVAKLTFREKQEY